MTERDYTLAMQHAAARDRALWNAIMARNYVASVLRFVAAQCLLGAFWVVLACVWLDVLWLLPIAAALALAAPLLHLVAWRLVFPKARDGRLGGAR